MISTKEIYDPGLKAVIGGRSAIGQRGTSAGIRYRGYPLSEMVEKAIFEEAMYLLLYGELPTEQQLSDFLTKVSKARCLPPKLITVLELLPKESDPTDVACTVVSLLSNIEPQGPSTIP